MSPLNWRDLQQTLANPHEYFIKTQSNSETNFHQLFPIPLKIKRRSLKNQIKDPLINDAPSRPRRVGSKYNRKKSPLRAHFKKSFQLQGEFSAVDKELHSTQRSNRLWKEWKPNFWGSGWLSKVWMDPAKWRGILISRGLAWSA